MEGKTGHGRRTRKDKKNLKEKAKKSKKTVIEAKRVAAQLRLMAGQLDHFADIIIAQAERNE